jgi:hypothetical protein
MYLLFGGVIKVRLVWFVSELGGLVGWSCPITPKEEEKEKGIASRASCQGQGQGGKVSSSSICGCFGWVL